MCVVGKIDVWYKCLVALCFCVMLFLELVSGDFLGEAGFGITFFVNELQCRCKGLWCGV